jgi:GTP-binding protein Era
MMASGNELEAATETRAGFVALVGRPNVGKSTLMNALTGERLSIVSPRAQTTRERVMAIYSDEHAQVVFVDTPGLLDPQYLLQRSMLEAALGAIGDSDAVLLLLDASRPNELPTPDGEAMTALRARRGALHVAINKIDEGDDTAVAFLHDWSVRELGIEPLRISAATGAGLDVMRERLIAALPASPFLYDAEDVAVQPVRFFVAEFVRETIFEEYEEEIPYATVVRVEEFREASDPIYIRVTVYVERDSQKAILIGHQGGGIKLLGARSREKIEALLGSRVYLDLWVKTLPGWRRKRTALAYLGYHLPDEEQPPASGPHRERHDR